MGLIWSKDGLFLPVPFLLLKVPYLLLPLHHPSRLLNLLIQTCHHHLNPFDHLLENPHLNHPWYLMDLIDHCLHFPSFGSHYYSHHYSSKKMPKQILLIEEFLKAFTFYFIISYFQVCLNRDMLDFDLIKLSIQHNYQNSFITYF